MPLIFRHRTGSSFSYTDGSQLYLVPLFPWTAVKGVGGDCGPWRKERRKVLATKRQISRVFHPMPDWVICQEVDWSSWSLPQNGAAQKTQPERTEKGWQLSKEELRKQALTGNKRWDCDLILTPPVSHGVRSWPEIPLPRAHPAWNFRTLKVCCAISWAARKLPGSPEQNLRDRGTKGSVWMDMKMCSRTLGKNTCRTGKLGFLLTMLKWSVCPWGWDGCRKPSNRTRFCKQLLCQVRAKNEEIKHNSDREKKEK